MRKWRIRSRKILAALLAAVMLAVMNPTTLVDAAAADGSYAEKDGEFYFWDEQGLRKLIEEKPDSYALFARSAAQLDDSNATLTITSDLTIPEDFCVYMGDGRLVVSAGATLTVNGQLEVGYDKVSGSVVRGSEDASYYRFVLAENGEELVSGLKGLGEAAATAKDGAAFEAYIAGNVTVSGDLTVPAKTSIYLFQNRTLTVTDKLTVESGALVYATEALTVGSMEIKSGSEVYAYSGIRYGSALTVNGKLKLWGRSFGTGTTSTITVGDGATLMNGYEAVTIADSWSVSEKATIENDYSGGLVVSVEHRNDLAGKENVPGRIYSVKMLTDAEASQSGALESAMDAFGSISDKADDEYLEVMVRSAQLGKPLQVTLPDDLTVDGAVDGISFLQLTAPAGTEASPTVTVPAGKTLTVALSKYLNSEMPFTVNGTLVLPEGGSMFNGTYPAVTFDGGLQVNGTVNSCGWVTVNGDMTIAAGGTFRQEYGSLTVNGTMTVNGTLELTKTNFTVCGTYIKGENATVNMGEWVDFDYQAKVEFNKAAILAAFAQENVSTVTVEVDEDVTLTKDLTIPKLKTLTIEGYGTLTIAPGVTLALEGYIRGENESPSTGNMGGELEGSNVTLVIQGTLDVGREAELTSGEVEVENGGKLIVQENGEYNSRGERFTVKSGGRVTNNGWMTFGNGDGITMEAGWDSAWTQGESATAKVSTSVGLYPEDNAAEAIQTAITKMTETLPEFFSYTVDVYREDEGESIGLTQNLTIPVNVELAFYNADVTIYVAEGAALTVQGGLYSDAPLTVDGKLTISADGWVNVRNNVLVGGTLTIDENGEVRCSYLTDENGEKTGKIVNNGSLTADEDDLKHNEVDTSDDYGGKVVRSLASLKSALEKGGRITYKGSELTIDKDLTIPEDVTLTINVNTFTVSKGVTLTNKGNVTLYGDMYLYGTIHVGNEWDHNFDGTGHLLAGDSSNVAGGYAFRWTEVIDKQGSDETLTQEEVTKAAANDLVDEICVELGENTTLTLEENITVSDKQFDIGRSGGKKSAVIINGTLSLWSYSYIRVPVTVNGTLAAYGDVMIYSDVTLSSNGKLHACRDENYWRAGSIVVDNEDGIVVPEDDTVSAHVTVDKGCTVGKRLYTSADKLEETICSCTDGQYYIMWVTGGNWSKGEEEPIHLAAGTALTIPETVTVQIADYTDLTYGFSEVVIGEADEDGTKGELTVNGRLEINVPVQVDGTLTVNGYLKAYNDEAATINGALTVNEGGEAYFSKLAGKGTIINNGTLTSDEKAIETVIGGSGTTTVYNTSLEASNMAELQAALNSLDGSTERQTIYLRRSAMDNANPSFVIDENITIPANVELYMEETKYSHFRGLTVAENARLTVAGQINIWGEGGVTVNGTLENKNNLYVRRQLAIAENAVIENTGSITYADCDVPDKIHNSGNGNICWDKTVNTEEELRELLTRKESGTAWLELQKSQTLAESLTIPENIQLIIDSNDEAQRTLTVPEDVTLTADGQLNIESSAALTVNGTLATSNNTRVYGALTINEGGVWQQESSAEVYGGSASVAINGLLEQSESWVELKSWGRGRISFGANAQWNEVGTVGCYGNTAITGFAPGKYELHTDGDDYYYLKRVSGGSSGGDVTRIPGDVNGDGVVDQADLVALARFVAGIDNLADTDRADINGDGISSAADLTALARMLEEQQNTMAVNAAENGAPVDTGEEQDTGAETDAVLTADGAPAEPVPAADDVPETAVEEPVTDQTPQTEVTEQAA